MDTRLLIPFVLVSAGGGAFVSEAADGTISVVEIGSALMPDRPVNRLSQVTIPIMELLVKLVQYHFTLNEFLGRKSVSKDRQNVLGRRLYRVRYSSSMCLRNTLTLSYII
jgi:hypothetical protein